MTWSLEQAYDAYPRIEEEFSAALDESLRPRGPDLLFDLVARLGLAPGAVALDVGCGEGRQAVALHRRFGFRVTGIDPVRPAHRGGAGRGRPGRAGLRGRHGREHPGRRGNGGPDLVSRRPGARPRPAARVRGIPPRAPAGGHALVYQMFGSELLEPGEAAWLWATMGVVPENADPARTEAAIAAAGLRIDERLEIGSEWSEWAEERHGSASRKLLHVSRLRRNRAGYLKRYGQAAYEMMLGDCLWHVYAMIGKLKPPRLPAVLRPARSVAWPYG